MNFLEQLVAEWYSFNGYFVQTNVKFGKRMACGYEGEMDVVAFHPQEKVLVHVETSSDADSWEERKRRLIRKFNGANKYYSELFQFGYHSVQKIAIVGFGRTRAKSVSFGSDIAIKTVPEYTAEISTDLKGLNPTKQAVPEHWPILRAMQLSVYWGQVSH